jgi:MFS family permease
MLAAIGLLSYNFNVTLPLFVTHVLHASPGIYTILYSIFSLGAVVSALVVAHRGMVRMQHIIIGAVALGLAMLILSAVPGISLAIPVIFLVGVASILYTTATTTMVQVEAKAEMRGRVLALQTVLLAGPTAIGGPVLGWMADAFGGRSPIILGGIVCLIAAILGYLATRHYIASPTVKELSAN